MATMRCGWNSNAFTQPFRPTHECAHQVRMYIWNNFAGTLGSKLSSFSTRTITIALDARQDTILLISQQNLLYNSYIQDFISVICVFADLEAFKPAMFYIEIRKQFLPFIQTHALVSVFVHCSCPHYVTVLPHTPSCATFRFQHDLPCMQIQALVSVCAHSSSQHTKSSSTHVSNVRAAIHFRRFGIQTINTLFCDVRKLHTNSESSEKRHKFIISAGKEV